MWCRASALLWGTPSSELLEWVNHEDQKNVAWIGADPARRDWPFCFCRVRSHDRLVAHLSAPLAVSLVPDGGALCLFGLGFLGLGGLKWRKQPVPGVGSRVEVEVAGDYGRLRALWTNVLPRSRTGDAGGGQAALVEPGLPERAERLGVLFGNVALGYGGKRGASSPLHPA